MSSKVHSDTSGLAPPGSSPADAALNEATSVSHSSPADYATVLEKLVEVCLIPTQKDGRSRIDQVFDQSVYHRPGPRFAASDPLLNFLGFRPAEIPDFHNNFNGAMGRLFEAIVTEIYRLRRPAIYSTDWSGEAGRLRAAGVAAGKFSTDLKCSDSAIELKYRFNSGQAATAQGNGADTLKALGLKPVLLSLRSDSPKETYLIKKGWVLHSGQGAIDYIAHHTNIDLIGILADLADVPAIKSRLKDRMHEIRNRRLSEQAAGYTNLPHDMRGRIHDIIASDETSLADIVVRRNFSGPDPSLLSTQAAALTDAAAKAREKDPVGVLVDAIDTMVSDASKADLVSRLLDSLSSTERLELAALRG